MIRMNRLVVLLSLASLALLSACGSDPEPEAAAAATPAPAAAPAPQAAPVTKPTPPPDDATAAAQRMARAVGSGKPGAAVEIRYEFRSKPSVGTPTVLEIAFIPSAGVDALNATIAGMDGITLAGPLSASFANVEAGKAYTHTISVLPDRSGVYYVSVQANTQIGGQSLARTFSIPFVVGNVTVQQKPAPARDAAGQAIEPMKAEETRR
jgi:hypothetical protein